MFDYVSRPLKMSNLDTLLYEVSALRWAANRLKSPSPSWTQGDAWVYLESFLVHYRNLIEFFGKPEPHKGDDEHDLTIRKPEKIWGEHSGQKLEELRRLSATSGKR